MNITLQVVLTEDSLRQLAAMVAEINAPEREQAPLTKKEAAAALKVSVKTIERRIAAGVITTVPDIGAVRIPLAEIERLQKGKRRSV